MGEIEIGEYIVEWDDVKAEVNYTATTRTDGRSLAR